MTCISIICISNHQLCPRYRCVIEVNGNVIFIAPSVNGPYCTNFTETSEQKKICFLSLFRSPLPSQFFPSGNAVITGSDDTTLKMYDLRADQEVIGYTDPNVKAGNTSLALSLSGRLIFAGYDDFKCNIWDVLKGEKVGKLGHAM